MSATRTWLLPLLCGAALLNTAADPGGPRALPGARLILTHPDEWIGDARIGTYVSSTWGFSTRSYWIEGPRGLVLVDTQFLPSATAEAVAWAERVTGKKVVLAVVLHANPDKFNGTGFLKKRGIRVITSAQVRALIPGVHERRLRAFYDRYQPDYPKELVLPDSFGDKTTELSAAGLTFKLHVLGPGCSEAHVALEYDHHLFVGDLVAVGSHSWMEIGRTDEWRRRLQELRALEPAFIHPGRGSEGDERLLDQEDAYLRTVQELVAAERARVPPGLLSDKARDEALERVKKQLGERYLGYRFAVFLDMGLSAEWRRQEAGRR